MLFKIAFFAILIGFILSLAGGLFFLFEDDGENKKRLFNTLAVRVSLAVLFIVLLTYGVMTGQIRSKAPWSQATTTHTENTTKPMVTPPASKPRQNKADEGQGPGLKNVE